jgi:hypothetical protein
MANTFKKVIDRQIWVSSAPAPNAHAAAVCLASDLRSDVSRNPFVYQVAAATVLNRYNIVTKSWNLIGSPGMAVLAAGAAAVFAPSFGLQGTIAAGATTTSIALTTALPAAVGINMLANRGGSGEYGFKIRVIGFTAGKTEERFIIANSGGTTPTLRLDNPLTFTPTSSDRYEILGGRLFMLSPGALGAASWRSMEVASNAFTNHANTNLPATVGTDSNLVCLDEQYTPYDCNPGEGFIKGAFEYDNNLVSRKALAATAAAAGTITGQATNGDAAVVANEYRNFQIRIVYDAVTPASVGQRRAIASHTAGPSAVYTLGANWTTTPSSSAKFVIEYPNLILARSTATNTVYTYNFMDGAYNNGTTNLAANTWSTTCFGVAPAVHAAGVMWMPSFGIRPDSAKNSRHSFIHCYRGTSATIDTLNIAGGTTGTWETAIVYDGSVALTAATSGCYSPFENEGRMFYLNPYTASAVNQIFRFDVQNRALSSYTPTDEIQAGTAALGNRMACFAAIDGTDTYDVVFLLSHLATRTQELIPLV